MTPASYVSHISDPKIPWSWRRTFDFFKAFFTAIVPPMPENVVEQRKKDWCKLTLLEKRIHIAWTWNQSTLRRTSMGETATRASYVLVGVAFVTGFGGNIVVAPDTAGVGKFLLQLGFSTIVLSTIISILAIAFKSKVMKRPRVGGESEADERLRRMVAISQAKADQLKHPLGVIRRVLHTLWTRGRNTGMEFYEEYEEAAEQLYRRKIMLTVERRAQWIASVIAVIGLTEVVVGIWNR